MEFLNKNSGLYKEKQKKSAVTIYIIKNNSQILWCMCSSMSFCRPGRPRQLHTVGSRSKGLLAPFSKNTNCVGKAFFKSINGFVRSHCELESIDMFFNVHLGKSYCFYQWWLKKSIITGSGIPTHFTCQICCKGHWKGLSVYVCLFGHQSMWPDWSFASS